MYKGLSKLSGGLLAIVLIIVAVIWFKGDDLEHIEDTDRNFE